VNRIGGRNAVSKGLHGGRGAFSREREREGERGRRGRGQNPSDVLLSDGTGLGEEILEGNGLVALRGGGVNVGAIPVSGGVGSGVVGVGAGNDLLPNVIDGLGGDRGDGLEEVVHGGRVVQIGEKKRGKGRYRRIAWQIRIRRDNLRRRHAAFQAVFFSLFLLSLSSSSTLTKEHTPPPPFLFLLLYSHFHCVSLNKAKA